MNDYPLRSPLYSQTASDRTDRLVAPVTDLQTLTRQNRRRAAAEYPDVPRPVGSVFVALSDLGVRSEAVTDLSGGWSFDFVLDVTGTDDFSRSSYIFDNDGSFLGGTLRGGTFREEDGIEAAWVGLLEDIGLLLDRDDIETEMREEGVGTGGPPAITPHAFFSSRSPSPSDPAFALSPVRAGEIVAITRLVIQRHDNVFSEFSPVGRVGDTGEDEGDVETIGSVDDMLDNL